MVIRTKHQLRSLSYDREHFFQILTYLIWGLWVHATYLFTEFVTKASDSPDWLFQTCQKSASLRVNETSVVCEMFPKKFSLEYLIILSLHTVIVMPIIVIV